MSPEWRDARWERRKGSAHTLELDRGHKGELGSASDWIQNEKNKLKVKLSRQTPVYLSLNETEVGPAHFEPMPGLVGCDLKSVSTPAFNSFCLGRFMLLVRCLAAFCLRFSLNFVCSQIVLVKRNTQRS